MPIRITGMNSGLDTESIISELVKAKSAKKDKLVKAQTKLQWKQDAWKELNTKVYSLYSKKLSNMRFESDYLKKTTKVSNATAATVITGSGAVNGVQTLKIDQLAKTGYLTGAQLQKDNQKANYGTGAKLHEHLGVEVGSKMELTVNGKTTTITVDEDMTIDSFVKKLQGAGVNASFDTKNQRFFISSKETGAKADFALTAKNSEGINALSTLGIATSLSVDKATMAQYLKYCQTETDADGNIVAKTDADGNVLAKSVADLGTLVEEEVNRRLSKYINNQKELASVAEKITKNKDSYKEKYGEEYGITTTSDLEKKLEEEKTKLNNTSDEEERKEIQDNIKLLEERISDSKSLDTLNEQQADLNAALDVEKDYFEEDGNGSYKLKENSTLRDIVGAEIEADANFAASVLTQAAKGTGAASEGATRIKGEDAKITLNGATFESTTNTFEINGLTITANAETKEEFTITTSDDTDGIYDMIKDFLKEYNELINEMDKLYNADSSKGYEPLTDEEKEAMSDKEVEKWEEKIKNSILRKDSTLNSVASAMKEIMLQGVTMGDGSKLYLSDFGISTLGYFNAADNEKNAYHIDGDPDDVSTSGNTDKLKTAIANDPDKVVEFFTTLSKNLYAKLGDMMKKTEYSSSFTLYDDIQMKDEYNDYTDKIKSQEEKITDFEDRYYKKFSAMETALAKLSSKESAISGLLGM